MGKLPALMLLVSFFILLVMNCGLAQQVVPEKQVTETQQEKDQEEIIASPKNIKEKTAICVFLGWMWISIFVLIYVLRQKINEADRLNVLKFYSNEKK